MFVDLVQTTTRDGVRLDGMFQAATVTPDLPLNALCFIHGTGGNFYSSTLFDLLGERLLSLGVSASLRVNTRGHDGNVSTAVTENAEAAGKRTAAYEIADDCRHDLLAWFHWLRQRTGDRVGLLGHSMGAVKSLYAAAHEPALAPACLIALSPPRLSYVAFCSSSNGREFLELYSRAEQLIADGQPSALLDVKLPLPYVITAAGYVEKYGPDERYNYFQFLNGVSCPSLMTFGEVEVANNMAFAGAPDDVAGHAVRHPHLHAAVIARADHFYTSVRPELLSVIETWLRELPS